MPAPAYDCHQSAEQEAEQRERADTLRGAVTRIERTPGHLIIEFSHEADVEVLARFVAGEHACGGHLVDLMLDHPPAGPRLSYAAKTPDVEGAFAILAQAFDPAAPATAAR